MNWAEAEMATTDLGDERLNRRLTNVLKRLGDDPAAGIPQACRGWAEVQGAYRLLAHENGDWEASGAEAALDEHARADAPAPGGAVSARQDGTGFYRPAEHRQAGTTEKPLENPVEGTVEWKRSVLIRSLIRIDERQRSLRPDEYAPLSCL